MDSQFNNRNYIMTYKPSGYLEALIVLHIQDSW